LAEILIFSLIVSQALLISTSASKSSKLQTYLRSEHDIALYHLPRLTSWDWKFLYGTCTPTKSNLYLDSSIETVIRDPVLYKLLTFHNPTFISILLLRSFIQRINPSPRLLCLFRNNFIFFRWRVVSPAPNPQARWPPLVACPRLIQYICSYPPSTTRGRAMLLDK
jgi:hypothetical protein